MINQKHKNNILFDTQNYQVIEYDDYFYSNKNKKVRVRDLGKRFASINSFFFEYLKEYNIPCAYIKKTGDKSLLFVKHSPLSFKVKILNSADKRISKIFDIKRGEELTLPVIEYHYGDGKDSVISESHLIAFNLCTYDDLKFINRLCSKINAVVKSFFERREENIAEFSCSFGKYEGRVYLIDDFSSRSLKIFRNNEDGKFPDPYKLETAGQMNMYTDHLYKFTNG
jgi:phosphoribosylaminoimidazole-succinocarboxamide synthase